MGAGNGRCSRCVPAIRKKDGSLQKNKSPSDNVVDYKRISACVASSTYAGVNVIASSYAGVTVIDNTNTTEHSKRGKRTAERTESTESTRDTYNSADGISSRRTCARMTGTGSMRTSDHSESCGFGTSSLNMAGAGDDKYISSTVTDITKAWDTSQSPFTDTVLSAKEGAPLHLVRPKYWDASMELVHLEDIPVVVEGQATTLREYLQCIGKPVRAEEVAYVRFQVVFLPSGKEAQRYSIQTRSSCTKMDENRSTLLVFDSRELLLLSRETRSTRSLPYRNVQGETGLAGFEGISDRGNVFLVVQVPAGSRRITVNITICESDDFGEAAAMEKLDELFDKPFILPWELEHESVFNLRSLLRMPTCV